MRSALYAGAGTVVVEDRESIPPGPGEVQIEVAYTGICGTDLHILHGAMDHRVKVPQPIGHEMSGRVAAVGADVDAFTVGQPVTVMPLDWCGDCPACRTGNNHICHRLTFVGIDSVGSMQHRWTVPAHIVVALPDGLSLRDAALVEPTAVAVHDVGRADLRPGESALVVGGGPVGLLIALVARSAGADVAVLELDPDRRAVARRLGLTAVDPAAEDVGAYVDTWTAGAGAAVAFEVSGSAAGVGIAVQSLATRGRLVMVAIHSQPREVDLHRFFWRELTMVGARVYQAADYRTAIDLLHRGEIPVDVLISRVVPLERAADAFAALAAGGVMKVLIDCAEPTGATDGTGAVDR